jgi:hypothetical protein
VAQARDLIGLRPLLAAHRALATVDLTDSGIGDEGAALVARALLANASVTALGLSGNRVRAPPERHPPPSGPGCPRAPRRCSARRGGGLLTCPARCTLQVGDEGVRVLAEALAGDATLLSLFLRNNAVGPAGAAHLAGALAGPPACGNATLQAPPPLLPLPLPPRAAYAAVLLP